MILALPGAARNRPKPLNVLCDLLSLAESNGVEGRLTEAIVERSLPWKQFVDFATDQLLAPAVYRAFERHGLSKSAPSVVRRCLRSMYRLNRVRNAEIVSDCIAIAAELNKIGVRPVFFKGSGHLLTGFYDDPAMRIMSDIDILLPENRSGDCIERLISCGYCVDTLLRHPKDQTIAVLYSPSGGVSVDLHRSLLAYPYDGLLTPDEVIGHAVEHRREGAVFAVLSPTHQVLVNVGHAELHHNHSYIYGRLALRALYDTALAARRWNADLDWQHIANQFARFGERTAFDFHFHAACELFGQAAPPGFSPNLAARLYFKRAKIMSAHPVLIRISDRPLRVAMLAAREFSDRDLRARLYRNMRDKLWWARHSAALWRGGTAAARAEDGYWNSRNP